MRLWLFLHFAGLKGQYSSKLWLGLENILKTRVFTCKKNDKNATNEISNNEKKTFFFYIFRLGKPRLDNLTSGIDSLRNFTSIIYF